MSNIILILFTILISSSEVFSKQASYKVDVTVFDEIEIIFGDSCRIVSLKGVDSKYLISKLY